jgi:type IV pilus assembly protein PilP
MLRAKRSCQAFLFVSIGTLLSNLLVFTTYDRESFAQEVSPQEASPSEASPEDTYRYNPAGKRDPFFSPLYRVTEQAAMASDETKTPLQRLDLGQFKVVGIILETGEPKALIEDSSGLGYIVTSGTLIGPKGGVIKSIESGRILVEEYETDFYGKRQALEKEMPLTVAESDTEGIPKGK